MINSTYVGDEVSILRSSLILGHEIPWSTVQRKQITMDQAKEEKITKKRKKKEKKKEEKESRENVLTFLPESPAILAFPAKST